MKASPISLPPFPASSSGRRIFGHSLVRILFMVAWLCPGIGHSQPAAPGPASSSADPASALPQRSISIRLGEGAQARDVALYDASYALVIGVSRYTNGWPSLPGVKRDVVEIRQALEKQGFTVEAVEDPEAGQLLAAYQSFISRRGQDPNARLLFYFSGHGHSYHLDWQRPGEAMGYIVPADAPNPNADLNGFLAKAVDMQQVDTWARRIQARHALFLFDSCFSGSFFSLSKAVPEHIGEKTRQPVRQFITAGKENETVPDQSIFRDQVVEALSGEGDVNKDGYVTGAELGSFLEEKVADYSRGGQHPQYGTILDPRLNKGDFVFQLPAKGNAPNAPRPIIEKVDVPAFSADDLLKQAREREEAAKSREEFAAAAKKAYEAMQTVDANAYVDARDKAAKWTEYLDKFGKADYQLAQARERRDYWKNWRPPTPEPTVAPASSTPPPLSKPDYAKKSDDGRFLVSAKGVILDTTTNLEWVVGLDKDTNYDEAEQWVKNLNLAGGEWRMPTREELKGLYQSERGFNAGDRKPGWGVDPVFGLTNWRWVWAEPRDSSSAWAVYIARGTELWYRRGFSLNGRVFGVRSRSRR